MRATIRVNKEEGSILVIIHELTIHEWMYARDKPFETSHGLLITANKYGDMQPGEFFFPKPSEPPYFLSWIGEEDIELFGQDLKEALIEFNERFAEG